MTITNDSAKEITAQPGGPGINHFDFKNYDPITREALQILGKNEEFREMWQNIRNRWGDSLTITPFNPKTLEEVLTPAYTEYNKMGVAHPTKIDVYFNQSSIKAVRAFSLLMELCNVERMDDYVALDREAIKLWPEEYATNRERIEWEVLKKVNRISNTYFPRLKSVDLAIVNSFDKYLEVNKKSGHFENYRKLGIYLYIKLQCHSILPVFGIF